MPTKNVFYSVVSQKSKDVTLDTGCGILYYMNKNVQEHCL
jgi:hypothetical protein